MREHGRMPPGISTNNRTVFARSATSNPLTGTAGGFAERTGIDPTVVRVALGVLSLASGLGILIYLGGFVLSGPPGSVLNQPNRRIAQGTRQVAAIMAIVAGVLMFVRETALWLGDSVTWPPFLAAFGALLIYVHGDTSGRGSLTDIAPTGSGALLRVGVGAVVVLGGMVFLVGSNVELASAGVVLVPVIVTIVGLLLIFGPWLIRLAQQLTNERRERIRSEERATMAAHLHDSVLQTLALIQRSDDPARVAALARAQERELRSWLFSDGRLGSDETLSSAVDALATRVEARHGVKVETVVVGDRALDDDMRTVLEACAEAVVNAAKHSGAPVVSVYIEAEDGSVDAYVRDAGRGFTISEVPADRQGIARSIRERMERIGGRTEITTAPGSGTEVRLELRR